MPWEFFTGSGQIKTYAGFMTLSLVLMGAQIAPAQELRESDDLKVKPVKLRLSDEAIETDKRVFRHIRTKIAAAKRQVLSEQTCALTKAAAWLDVAEEEYDENEEGEIVDVTLREAQRLLKSLDHSVEPVQPKILLLETPTTVRPDLWLQLTQLRGRGGSCACASLARLEVQLSWADHEAQEGRQHAGPYIEAAERLAESAKQEADHACPLAASVPSSLPPVGDPVPHDTLPNLEPPAVAQQASVLEPTETPKADIIKLATLPWSVHFPTNRSTISTSTARVLDRVSEVLLLYPNALVRLEGHADQRGDASYNQTLSDRRTKAVKAYLVNAGLDPDHISTTALGNSRPLTRSRQNRELARNRRVVIVVTNLEEIRPEEQESDLQMDQRKHRKPSRQIKRGGKQDQSNKVTTDPLRKTR